MISPAKLALYEKLVATNPHVQRKGAANPYTSVNGHMFSFLTKTGALALRLPKDERDAFLKKYRTKLAVSYETVMKEYALVPATLLKNTRELKKHFDRSYAYVSSLEPKPTTRKKKTTAKKKSAKKKTAKKKTATKKKVTTKKKTARKASTAKKTTKKAPRKTTARKKKATAKKKRSR